MVTEKQDKSRTNTESHFDLCDIHKELVGNGHLTNICINVLFPRFSKHSHVTNVCQICQSWEPGFTEEYISTADNLLQSTRYFKYVAAISRTCRWVSLQDNHPFITHTKYFHFATNVSYSTSLLQSLP